MKWKGHLPLHRAKLISLACATLTEARKGKGFLKETLGAKGPGKDALLNTLKCSKRLCKESWPRSSSTIQRPLPAGS